MGRNARNTPKPEEDTIAYLELLLSMKKPDAPNEAVQGVRNIIDELKNTEKDKNSD